MATHRLYTEEDSFYFITLTCHFWWALFEACQIYSYVPFWFSKLEEQDCYLSPYVIMPNHLRMIVYKRSSSKKLNQVLAEGKRFFAYEIIKGLKKFGKTNLLEQLAAGVQQSEQKKGKKHQVFRSSFDAKFLKGQEDIEIVMDYIHHNPVSGNRNLAKDYRYYTYSSASFYD